jgi:predicted transcriptional regulator
MQRAKDHALSIIQGLPDNASYEDILYEIEFQREIAEGKEQIKRGASVTHEETMERLRKWLE